MRPMSDPTAGERTAAEVANDVLRWIDLLADMPPDARLVGDLAAGISLHREQDPVTRRENLQAGLRKIVADWMVSWKGHVCLECGAPAGEWPALKLIDTPHAAVNAAEECLAEFGHNVSGECSVYVANAVLRAVAASPPAGGPREVGESVLDVANEMLQSFAHPGHPGEACLQSGWVPVRRVAEWRAVLKAAAAPRGQREQARRYRALPDCPACQGAGGFGPGTGFDQNGEWNGEPCEDCGGTGKTGFPWRSGEAICPVCGHAWSRHDPEDGCCDAPSTLDPGPCFCGRSLAVWRSKNIALRAAAPAPVGEPKRPDITPQAILAKMPKHHQTRTSVENISDTLEALVWFANPAVGETPGAAEGRTEALVSPFEIEVARCPKCGHTEVCVNDGENINARGEQGHSESCDEFLHIIANGLHCPNGDDERHRDCGEQYDVVLQVLCRAFDDDIADQMDEWRSWYDPKSWMWWARGFGAFIRMKIARSAASVGAAPAASGAREPEADNG